MGFPVKLPPAPGVESSKHHTAIGVWGSPYRRTRLEQVSSRIRVLLQDKLVTGGKYVGLWLPVTPTTPGVVPCTCTKNTTDSADRACQSCFGAKFCPGFLKFLHQTLFWSSAETSLFTLTNAEIVTTKKAHVIMPISGNTTATIITQNKAYSNPDSVDWELKFDAYRRATGGTFTLEFSIDSGGSWTPIVLTEVPNPGHGFTGSILGTTLTGVGTVMFRVTMTRALGTDLPPAFEIIRLRRKLPERENLQLIRQRPDHQVGSILILKSWSQEVDALDPGRGRLIDHQNHTTWTSPLDFFDTTIAMNTPPCRIDEAFGPHPFYEFTSGIQQTTRYVITQVNYNDCFENRFTWQGFIDRRSQEFGENYSYCF